jgi:dTDP-4-amino-4,6-dideoxygalactose transaminase
MACAQIEQLNSFVLKKRELAKHYETFFENNSQIRFIMEPLNSNSNYWLNSILLNSKIKRDLFLKITNENGVMTRPVWTLLNKLPMFIDCYNDGLEVSEFMEERLVNLPSSVSK